MKIYIIKYFEKFTTKVSSGNGSKILVISDININLWREIVKGF